MKKRRQELMERQLSQLVEKMKELKRIQFMAQMALPPFFLTIRMRRVRSFAACRDSRRALRARSWDQNGEVSMGMTNDFVVAIEGRGNYGPDRHGHFW